MKRFLHRDHPVDVEAVLWDGTRECWEANFAVHGYVMSLRQDLVDRDGRFAILINAPFCDMLAYPGDWIVKYGPSAYAALSPGIFGLLYQPESN